MKANLTYSLISATLKQGMYLLVNNHLGYVSKLSGDLAVISFYHEDNKVIKLSKIELTREDAINTYGDKVIKLIALVGENPISINHKNYSKIFAPMLTFEKDSEESYISQFIANKTWHKQIIGDIQPIYSKLKPEQVVTIANLDVIDKFGLYDIKKRLVTVKRMSKSFVYSGVNEDGLEVTFARKDVVVEDNDKYDLFSMNFEGLKDLVNKGEAKTVEAKGKTKKEVKSNRNPFYNLHKSNWHATYDRLPGNENYQWLAVRDADDSKNEAQMIVPISVPIANIPKHQFSGYDNDYWIPGTIKQMDNATADMKRFVPFREGLPIFGKLTETIVNDKKFVYFLLDNLKQESVNSYIYKNRDITEERRSALTLKKLPTL